MIREISLAGVEYVTVSNALQPPHVGEKKSSKTSLPSSRACWHAAVEVADPIDRTHDHANLSFGCRSASPTPGTCVTSILLVMMRHDAPPIWRHD
jgi:hypothetical protein